MTADLADKLEEAATAFDGRELLACWNGPEGFDLVKRAGRREATDFAADLLRSAAAALRKEWRPIETAPKAGVDEPPIYVLLAWTNRFGPGGVGEGYWKPEEGAPDAGDWWWTNTGPHEYATDTIANSISGQITHWMPLPDPPSPGGARP